MSRMIVDGHGNEVCSGLPDAGAPDSVVAERTARESASRWGAPVWLVDAGPLDEDHDDGDREGDRYDPVVEVTVSRYRPTSTGVRYGVDADVHLRFGDVTHDGEITVLRGEADPSRWGAWGSPDHWTSDEIRAAITDWPTDLYRDVLSAIEAAVDSRACDRALAG